MGMKPRFRPNPMPALIVDAARVVLHNSLVEAARAGRTIVRRNCACTDVRELRHDRVCVLCAYLGDRERTADPTDQGARLLGVEEAWVTSLLAGWDGDPLRRDEPFRDAHILGRRLWRQHGPR